MASGFQYKSAFTLTRDSVIWLTAEAVKQIAHFVSLPGNMQAFPSIREETSLLNLAQIRKGNLLF